MNNEWLDILVNLVNAGLMIYLYGFYCSSFATPRFSRLWHFLGFGTIITAFTLVLTFMDQGIYRMCLTVLFSLCIAFLYKFKWYYAFLHSFVMLVISSLGEFLILSLWSDLILNDSKQSMEGIYFIIGMLMSKLLIFCLIVILRLIVKKNSYSTSIKKTVITTIMPLATLVITAVQQYYLSIIPADQPVWPVLVVYPFLIIANFVVFDFIEHLYQDAEKESRLQLAQKMIAAQTAQYEQLLNQNHNVAKLRHDTKNFLIGLAAELEEKGSGYALEELKKQIGSIELPMRAKYPAGVIGDIVCIKAEQIAEKGIEIDFTCPEQSFLNISEIDLAIIIGNALDNAIEAVEKLPPAFSKQISVFVRMHNNQIIVIIKNPVAENVDTDDLKTTKKGAHGLGLISIQNLAAKYGGEVILSCENLVFCAHIVLRNSEI